MKKEHVRILVFNLLGQRLEKLIDKYMSRGTHTVTFDGSELVSGVYIPT